MISHEAKLSELLAEKGSAIYCVEPEATVAEAVVLMNQKNIGSVLVMHGAEVTGIFTERDVLTRVVGSGRDPVKTRVHEVMSRKLAVVKPGTTVDEAMRIISEKRFRHLPVMDGDRVLGMISINDLNRWLVREDESYIENLLNYISGKYPG